MAPVCDRPALAVVVPNLNLVRAVVVGAPFLVSRLESFERLPYLGIAVGGHNDSFGLLVFLDSGKQVLRVGGVASGQCG